MGRRCRMNAPSARSFEAKPAVRESVPLLVGLMGPSGGGKTFSALRLATGIQKIHGGEIYGIDTEARRMLHYADRFKFRHVQFDAPFGSLDYLSAIRQCVKAGAGVVIIDSMSHEHDNVGGLLDFHDKELDRLAGDDYGKRDRMKMLAWQKPKAARQAMISGILQLNANFIFCFRAKEKLKIIAGKQPIPQGFMPIAGEELAAWAKGGAEPAGEAATSPPSTDSLPGDAVPSLLDTARAKASEGKSAFSLWFKKLDDDDQAKVDAISDDLRERWTAAAEASRPAP